MENKQSIGTKEKNSEKKDIEDIKKISEKAEEELIQERKGNEIYKYKTADKKKEGQRNTIM